MFELVITVTMSLTSLLLFGYWFRYTCHLILDAASTHDYSTSVAQAHHLCFQEAQMRLSHNAPELDRLKDMLDHDYATLSRLMSRAGGRQERIELRMLAVYYRLTTVWYRTCRWISTAAARMALQEMSMVVAHFANSLGEAAASSATA
jgi:hypothetical protein